MLTLSSAVIAVAATGCSLVPGANAEHTVVYKVSATGNVHVEYGDLSKGRTGVDVSKSWTKTVTITGWNGVGLAVVSTAVSDKPAKVSCEILVDGKSVSKNSAEGVAATTTCQATSFS